MSHPIKPNKVSIFKISPPPSPSLKTPSIRSRLSKLRQEGQLHLARQLFDTLPAPTMIICNSIIIGFICNNLPFEAILFYSKLKSSSLGTKFDSYTYSSTFKACAETRSLKIVHKVFDAMRKRDVVAWNNVVSWYVKVERHVEAIKLFSIMMKTGIKLIPIGFVNIFLAFSSVGDFKNADVLFGMLVKMGSEYVNDLFVVSTTSHRIANKGNEIMVEHVEHDFMQTELIQSPLVDMAVTHKSQTQLIKEKRRTENKNSTVVGSGQSTIEIMDDNWVTTAVLENACRNDTIETLPLAEATPKEKINTINAFECLNMIKYHSMNDGILIEHIEPDLSPHAASKGSKDIDDNLSWVTKGYRQI
ncbi:unnamed protein product [Dovyalis caffra]|uniref:Pentatricopeptide repeat-containing protein n=1 Tax=Dovyalis caffra TaxID=77055 RepID=A0AAV1RWX1_9ROSI|nr:unnamed protein product [Dovyalis caffra]